MRHVQGDADGRKKLVPFVKERQELLHVLLGNIITLAKSVLHPVQGAEIFGRLVLVKAQLCFL